MCSKIFKRAFLLLLCAMIFFLSACNRGNPPLGLITWGFPGETDTNGKSVDDYTDYFKNDDIFYVGEDDIEELVLDAQFKTEAHGFVSITIINNSRDDKVEWSDTFEGGSVGFSIKLLNLKAGDIYSIIMEANNIKTFNFGITPSGNIEFAEESSSDIYKAVKK